VREVGANLGIVLHEGDLNRRFVNGHSIHKAKRSGRGRSPQPYERMGELTRRAF
jgi:hypothetical protein